MSFIRRLFTYVVGFLPFKCTSPRLEDPRDAFIVDQPVYAHDGRKLYLGFGQFVLQATTRELESAMQLSASYLPGAVPPAVWRRWLIDHGYTWPGRNELRKVG